MWRNIVYTIDYVVLVKVVVLCTHTHTTFRSTAINRETVPIPAVSAVIIICYVRIAISTRTKTAKTDEISKPSYYYYTGLTFDANYTYNIIIQRFPRRPPAHAVHHRCCSDRVRSAAAAELAACSAYGPVKKTS